MPDSPFAPVVRAAVKVAIGVALLLLVQLAVSNLPMLNESIPFGDVYLTYGVLVTAALNTAIFVLLFRFGSELRSGANHAVATVPEIGRIAQLAVWLLTVALAYVAYRDIAAALFGTGVRVYQFVFVTLALVNIGAIGALVFRNLDALTDFTMRSAQTMRQRAAASATAQSPLAPEADTLQRVSVCPKCGGSIDAMQRFCRSCGAALQGA